MSWHIKAGDFPRSRDFEDQMKFILSYAVLAPSSHNTQPWKFEVDKKNRYLHICLDWQNTLPYSDRLNREAYISLGCTLANLIVALEYFDCLYSIEYFPEDSVEDIAIRVKIGQRIKRNTKNNLSSLLPYITKRITNRFFPEKKPISKDILLDIKRNNDEKDIRTIFVTNNNEIKKTAQIMYQAIYHAFGDKMFKEELSKWVRSNYTRANDGIPLYDSGIPSPLTILAPLLIKLVPPKLQAMRDKKLVENSSSLLILTSENNNKTAWIKTGKVFEFLALAGTAHSLFFSPMAGIIEHEDSCINLKKTLHIKEYPLFFARIAYVNKIPPHSPRRLVE